MPLFSHVHTYSSEYWTLLSAGLREVWTLSHDLVRYLLWACAARVLSLVARRPPCHNYKVTSTSLVATYIALLIATINPHSPFSVL